MIIQCFKISVYNLLNLQRAQNWISLTRTQLGLAFCLAIASLDAGHPNETVFRLQEGNRFLNEGKEIQAAELINALHFYPYQPLKKYQNILKARTLIMKSPQEAIALLKLSQTKEDPWSEAAKYAEAWGWILQGDKESAWELLQDEANPPELQLLKAKLFLALDKPVEGLAALEKVNQPDDDHLYDLTEVLLIKSLMLRTSETSLNGKSGNAQAIELLEGVELESLNGHFRDYLYLTLGKLYFENGNYDEAQNQWMLLLQKFPHSPYRPDALYWIARAKEETNGDPKETASIHREITLKYPDFAYADEVYFNQYSLKEYLQGDREAVIHLDRFSTLHPSSPLTIVANYLIGLDKKEERRSIEGKSIRRKNVKDAIHAFELSQKNYDRLKPEELYYRHVRNLAALERGNLYMEISNESNGPKKDIYRRYALEQLSPLVNEDKEISAQAVVQLAAIYMAQGELEQAKLFVSKELEKWEDGSGAALVTLNTIQGQIAHEQRDYETAWHYFVKAEEKGEGKFLSHDQELDLWIRQALCYQELELYDQAMLLFSKAINRNVVSSQRLRAMYLRAEVYLRQGREELAKKQWEAVALKGGEWAQRAKKKLEEGE